MTYGRAAPVIRTGQALGFNVGLPSSAEYARITQDTGMVQSFYLAPGSNGVISTVTGLPVSGNTKLTIQTRGGIKYPEGDYTVSWTGNATVGGQSSPITLTVSGPTSGVTYFISGEMTSFSIVPIGNPPGSGPGGEYSETFAKRAARGDCLRWMECWRINEDGGTGGAVYDPTHPYVRIRSVAGANTFYHQILRPSFVGQTCLDFQKDCWICFHHRATDQNVTDAINEILATGFRGTLYVEWSNETWNSGFPQYQYCNQAAIDSGNYPTAPGDTARVAAYSADRTHQMGAVAKAAYDDVVVVWGGWQAVPNTFNQAMDYGIYAPFPNIDAGAISWYFGGPESRALSLEDAENLTAQGAADLCRTDWNNRVIPLLNTWKGQIDGWGKRMIGYEGGSHLDRRPEDAASAHLSQLSNTPEVGVVHGEVMDWWNDNIGDLAVFFQDTGNPDDPWSWLPGELGDTSGRLAAFYDRAK